MSLARQALESLPGDIIPLVFYWKDKIKDSPGWSIIEWKGGVDINDTFSNLDLNFQEHVMQQVAQTIRRLQDFEPPTILNFGGLGFDKTGALVGCPMNLPCGGSLHSYPDLVKGMLDWQLAARKSSKALEFGRDERKIEDRITAFRNSPIRKYTSLSMLLQENNQKAVGFSVRLFKYPRLSAHFDPSRCS